MKSEELKRSYIEFFKNKGHKEIPNASLIPEYDPAVLFTTAGMHPLVPFLLGQKHPLGKRLVGCQRCLRTTDIDKVGDAMHLSFFEMLGNWSLGDYWKKEAITWSYEFLTKVLKIDPNKLHITCFGNKSTKDEETAKIWQELGIAKERIHFLEDNWWGPPGETGPCGPCSEMFVDTGKEPCSKECKPGCPCGKYFEIWNDVFLQYNKTKIKALLVDAICLFDKYRQVNKELLEIINSYNVRKILVTNIVKSDPKNQSLIETIKENKIELFSLEGNPKKNDPNFFKRLLNEYKLNPEEVIYFDHSEENINSAKKAGIAKVHLYRDNQKTKEFIENNLYYFKLLKQKNVDTGMGVERTVAALQQKSSVYEIETLAPIMEKIKEIAKIEKLKDDQLRSARIVVDHLRASTFILGDEKAVVPSNKDQGYVLRRFIRRAIRHGKLLGINKSFMNELAKVVIEIYKKDYPLLKEKEAFILEQLKKEEEKFRKTLEKGIDQFNKLAKQKCISGKDAFLLFQSYGFPIEMIKELAQEKNIVVDEKGFFEEFKKHQEISRAGAKKFKSGLADTSHETTKLHTATHLLLYALRKVLGPDIIQKGSNITPERIRFDFNFDRKLTEDEIKKIEKIVNEKIEQGIPVVKKEMPLEEAKKIAKTEFEYKTPVVSVYVIDDCIEICAGPHVSNTKELAEGNKKFKIISQEAVAAGIRRVKAVLS